MSFSQQVRQSINGDEYYTQQDAVDMTKKLSDLEDTLVALDSSIAKKLDLLRDREIEIAEEKQKLEQAKIEFESKTTDATPSEPVSFTEALAEKFADETVRPSL